MKVLFVCSGNICRSPMAAEWMRHRAAAWGLDHIVVDSAGTLGIEGAPAADAAIRAMREVGVDLWRHRSRGLTALDLETVDAMVVMAGEHRDEIAARRPPPVCRPVLLRAFESGPRIDPDPPDLEDPVGEPLDVFREQRERILRCVDHLALYLKHCGSGGWPR